ncbi:hypothetical protein AYI68_g3550 [Smittium mucronatum]|uniref:Uncharacterized protein n=1 Tax=Smittium mucronatum TaxID=133383 RepID=A0A1R0GZJ3_9FUNG|nr:hypothetical protein AYI68_g3550 [Smittium mucronatum]
MDSGYPLDVNGCIIGCPDIGPVPTTSCQQGYRYAITPFACTQCPYYTCIQDTSYNNPARSIGLASIVAFSFSFICFGLIVFFNYRSKMSKRNLSKAVMLNSDAILSKSDSLYGSKLVDLIDSRPINHASLDLRNSILHQANQAGPGFRTYLTNNINQNGALSTRSILSSDSGINYDDKASRMGISGIFSTHGPITVKALHNGKLVDSKLSLSRRSARDSGSIPHIISIDDFNTRKKLNSPISDNFAYDHEKALKRFSSQSSIFTEDSFRVVISDPHSASLAHCPKIIRINSSSTPVNMDHKQTHSTEQIQSFSIAVGTTASKLSSFKSQDNLGFNPDEVIDIEPVQISALKANENHIIMPFRTAPPNPHKSS